MARKVAFALIENRAGPVLLIQRGYGREKYRWSLPGGHVDRGESNRRAAVREAREETGFHVEIVYRIDEGYRAPWKAYFAKIKGGRLRPKRPECLDAKFFDYDKLPKLAFDVDRRVISNRLKDVGKSPEGRH